MGKSEEKVDIWFSLIFVFVFAFGVSVNLKKILLSINYNEVFIIPLSDNSVKYN